VKHSKADLTIYRNGGASVVKAIKDKVPSCVVEKASIDEVYRVGIIDIT